MNLDHIRQFSEEQAKHIRILQDYVKRFCDDLMFLAVSHDHSKFSEEEFAGFLATYLNTNKGQLDENYKNGYTTKAVQHHVTTNDHHPEFWDKYGRKMPIAQAIIMFFDWFSRAEGDWNNFEKFWEYNISKLNNQKGARVIVEMLKDYVKSDLKYVPGL